MAAARSASSASTRIALSSGSVASRSGMKSVVAPGKRTRCLIWRSSSRSERAGAEAPKMILVFPRAMMSPGRRRAWRTSAPLTNVPLELFSSTSVGSSPGESLTWRRETRSSWSSTSRPGSRPSASGRSPRTNCVPASAPSKMVNVHSGMVQSLSPRHAGGVHRRDAEDAENGTRLPLITVFRLTATPTAADYETRERRERKRRLPNTAQDLSVATRAPATEPSCMCRFQRPSG